MEAREIKGLEIAAKHKLTRKGKSNLWLVPSQTGQEEEYTVAMQGETPECTCRDFEFRNTKCKHIFAVEYTIQREQTADGQTLVTETVTVTRQSYPQDWPAYNAAQTQEKSQLQALLYELCRDLLSRYSKAEADRDCHLLTLFFLRRSRFIRLSPVGAL